MRNKYFKILGLQPGASDQQIKKAYRRLAMRYHPDKDPSPESKAKFQIIVEAYEILTEQRPVPGQKKIRRPQPQNQTKEEIIKERMKKAREQYQKNKEREEYEQILFFKKLTSGRPFFIFRIFCILNALIALGFTIDYFAPVYDYTGKVKSFKESNLGFYVVDIGDVSVEVTAEIAAVIPAGGMIHVKYTPIYGTPVFMEIINGVTINEKQYYMNNEVNLGSLHRTLHLLFPLTQLLFLYPMYHWFRRKRTIYYTMAHYGAIYFLPLFFLLSLLLRYRVF